MSFIIQLLEHLRKKKVYSSCRDNIWGFDLTDMQSPSEIIKGINLFRA